MTISRKDLKEAYDSGVVQGIQKGRELISTEAQHLRKQGVVEIARAVADLAMANAKLTYAMSRITDKLL